MDKDSPSKVALKSTAESKLRRTSLLRLSRLQVSEFHLDDDNDDEDAQSQQQDIFEINFKRGETVTIQKVLKEAELIALERDSEGFNEVNFSLGVITCFFLSFMIGAYPQHLWLVYLILSLYMIPRKFQNMWRAKPLNQALYYLDFCWCMNFMALISLALLVISGLMDINVNEDARKILFKSSLGVGCGVLLAANIALPFVACLFHDVNSMTGLFIHLMPPMVLYTFMWHSEATTEAWPGIFDFSYLDEVRYYGGAGSVAACATCLYFIWFIGYISFMLLVGINLPKKFKHSGQEAHPKWDTVFHSTLRGGVCIAMGNVRGRKREDSLKQMEENDFDLVDFFTYMVVHMIAALGAIYTIGYCCFVNKYFHLAMLGGSAVVAVVRGANRYTYYTTKIYARTLRKQFAHIIDNDSRKEGYSRMT